MKFTLSLDAMPCFFMTSFGEGLIASTRLKKSTVRARSRPSASYTLSRGVSLTLLPLDPFTSFTFYFCFFTFTSSQMNAD